MNIQLHMNLAKFIWNQRFWQLYN